ncbi:BLUF domain-containing protein [Aquimarina pacifica]|uniref:BLUF domain-containing protein n=1 Tax=Aquimarina pacifica TaxID=1296415 RepID=UPI000470BDCB|nr:BLUF domain-containing protein [Aquimarina pacifica]
MNHIISYVSTASKSLSNSDIKELFNFVEEFNNKNSITGILMYSNGNFFQILEGDEETILVLFEKIKKDSRHYDIIKMLDKEIDTSSFFKYNSSFTTRLGDQPIQIPENLIKQNDQAEHYKSTYYLLQKFMSHP